MPEPDGERLAAREDLCRLLAACYYEPDAELAEQRVFDAMLAAASRLDPALADCARRLGQAFAGHDLKALAADYDRLFGGGARVPPQGSRWLGRGSADGAQSTAALLALYQEGGFEIEQGALQPPDHVALQLEFLYRITAKQSEGRRAGWDAQVLQAWQHLQQLFLRSHLGTWIPRFTAAVEAKAQTPFYRELAQLTERFVRIEFAA